MSRQNSPRQKSNRSADRSGGGIVIGLFIGLVLGALCAAGAAWYFARTSPFQETKTAPPAAPAANQAPITLPGKPGDRPVEKQNYEFYKILPQGVEATANSAPVPSSEAPRAERLYLQVGAFEDPAEADNLKALLTLNGIEASAQRAQLADGRIVHRVRIGPFSKPEEMNPMRARLASAGFTATVMRANP